VQENNGRASGLFRKARARRSTPFVVRAEPSARLGVAVGDAISVIR